MEEVDNCADVKLLGRRRLEVERRVLLDAVAVGRDFDGTRPLEGPRAYALLDAELHVDVDAKGGAVALPLGADLGFAILVGVDDGRLVRVEGAGGRLEVVRADAHEHRADRLEELAAKVADAAVVVVRSVAQLAEQCVHEVARDRRVAVGVVGEVRERAALHVLDGHVGVLHQVDVTVEGVFGRGRVDLAPHLGEREIVVAAAGCHIWKLLLLLWVCGFAGLRVCSAGRKTGWFSAGRWFALLI